MESCLKGYLVCAMVGVLAACQTPTASNQGTTSSKATTGTGQSASPSSRYEVDTVGTLLPPNFPRYQGRSVRGPCALARLDRQFKLHKRRQLFIRTNNETLSVAERCASAIQIVRPSESTPETQPQLQPGFQSGVFQLVRNNFDRRFVGAVTGEENIENFHSRAPLR